jgi:hypothetical protein
MSEARRSISLAMIVRDEERCLARCLASVAEHVDEVVVVDTGSVDGTVAIAESFGARVHVHAWADDFAQARNESLSRTTGDWILVLDADEWIEEGHAALDRLRSTPPDFLGEVSVTSSIDGGTAGSTTTASWIPRVLPRGTRYVGRVHEQPDVAGPLRRLDLSVGHDGYLPDALEAKRGRNAALLERELAGDPDDGYLLLQLGRAYEADRRHADAAAAYERARRVVPPEAPARHDLVVRSMFCLGQAGSTAAALALAEEEMPRWQESPDFHFCLGDLLLTHGLAHPDEAAGAIPLIESLWLRCLELGERPDLVGAVHGRGSFLAAHNLATLYDAVGDEARAATYRALAR